MDPKRAAAALRKRTALRPSLGIVLGSGFQGVADELRLECELGYHEVPGFPQPKVLGHVGKLLAGHIGETPVVLLSGRVHYYEGYSMAEVTFGIRVLVELGVTQLLLTNAAGGINSRFRPGDFMVVEDHINLMGVNPLRGSEPGDAARFVDMSSTYDSRLARQLVGAGKRVGLHLRRGVYLAVSGPSYETPAEIRAFKRLGADAVGMSTVPEAMVARACGMQVAALSCITNLAAGLGDKPISHQEVLAMAEVVSAKASRLIRAFVNARST